MNCSQRVKHLGVLILMAALGGCGGSPLKQSLLPPPVSIHYRPSLVGVGQVVQISNQSNHHLYDVTVVGRSFQQVSSASVKAADHLAPWQAIEVGWLEFGSWIPQPGETIEVYADDYAVPKTSIIPKN